MIDYEKARKHAEFSRIPEHVLAGVYAFVEHRSQPGHFLTCVLTNDLFGAVGRADSESGATLRELVGFIHAEVPTLCYGTNAKVREWLFPQPKPCSEVPLEG